MKKTNFKRWPNLKAWEKRVLFVQMAARAHSRYLAERADIHAKYCRHAGLAVSVSQARVDSVKVDSAPWYQVPAFDHSKID